MVLVPHVLYTFISLLQTKLSDRERHETRHVGLEALPLDEDIEGGHGEGEPRLEIRPAPVHDLFEMADERQTSSAPSPPASGPPTPPVDTVCDWSDRPRQHGSRYHSGRSCGRRPAEAATETCSRRHGPCHRPTPPPGHTGATADRVYPRQSSDGWTGLCARSAGGCGLRVWGGATQSPRCR